MRRVAVHAVVRHGLLPLALPAAEGTPQGMAGGVESEVAGMVARGLEGGTVSDVARGREELSVEIGEISEGERIEALALTEEQVGSEYCIVSSARE